MPKRRRPAQLKPVPNLAGQQNIDFDKLPIQCEPAFAPVSTNDDDCLPRRPSKEERAEMFRLLVRAKLPPVKVQVGKQEITVSASDLKHLLWVLDAFGRGRRGFPDQATTLCSATCFNNRKLKRVIKAATQLNVLSVGKQRGRLNSYLVLPHELKKFLPKDLVGPVRGERSSLLTRTNGAIGDTTHDAPHSVTGDASGVIRVRDGDRDGTLNGRTKKNYPAPVPRGGPEHFFEMVPELENAAQRTIRPEPPGKLVYGLWKFIGEKDLRDGERVIRWFQMQLSIAQPICPGTEAHLLLVLAAALEAIGRPIEQIKKNRCALFVTLVNKRLWREVLHRIPAARAFLDNCALKPAGAYWLETAIPQV